MTIAPELADLVRAANEAPPLPLHPSAVDQLRELARMGALAYGPGPDLSKVENRTVPGPRGPIPVRVYYPDADPILAQSLKRSCASTEREGVPGR